MVYNTAACSVLYSRRSLCELKVPLNLQGRKAIRRQCENTTQRRLIDTGPTS